jgi:hypothetical protein
MASQAFPAGTKNKQIMEQTDNHYFLYCLNMQCQYSVYQLMVEVRLPITTENLLSTHSCYHCHHPLVTSLDRNAWCLVAELRSKPLCAPAYPGN